MTTSPTELSPTGNLRNFLSRVFLIPDLIRIKHENGLSKNRKKIITKDIMDSVLYCNEHKSDILGLSASIDERFIPLINECYEFIAVVENQEQGTGYLAKSLEDNILSQIRELLEIAENKEMIVQLIEPFLVYPLVVQSEVQDREKIEELHNRMKENRPKIQQWINGHQALLP